MYLLKWKIFIIANIMDDSVSIRDKVIEKSSSNKF